MSGNTPAAVVGIQVPTTDLARSVTFYREVFGWSFSPDDQIAAIEHADTEFGFSLSPVHGPHASGGTFVNVAVDDIEATLGRAVQLGSQVLIEPTTAPFGTIAMIDDPSGAHLLLVEAR